MADVIPGLPSRYRVRSRLGQGGMATVYLADDEVSGSPVAIKVLLEHLTADETIVARFRREVAAARRVRHKNVIAIYDVIVEPPLVCMVLEYHPGTDLAQWAVLRGRPAPEVVVALATQILDALEVAHAEGVVHRDLKPQNVLVDDAGQARLTDFGIARVEDAIGLTTDTMMLGTPAYMAPESLASPLVDGRADLYALGVTLYELLTGELPFRAASPMAVAFLHRSEAVPDPRAKVPSLPEALAAVVQRAMAKEPEDRFQTAAEMRAALLGGGAPAALVASAPEHRCARCQAPLLPGLAACVECRAVRLRPRRRRGGKGQVWIGNVGIGAGQALPLTPEVRLRIADVLRECGAELPEEQRLESHLRLSTMLVSRELDEKDAEGLVEVLRARQIPASSATTLGQRIRGFASADGMRGLAMLGVATAAATAAGIALAKAGLLAGEASLLLFLGAWFVAWLALIVAFGWSPMARFSEDGGAPALPEPPVARRAAGVFGAISSPRLRALLRRTLARGLSARQRLGDGAAGAGEIDAALDAVLDVAARVAALEAEHGRTDAQLVVERLKAVDEALARPGSPAEQATLVDEKVRLAGELDANAGRQQQIVRGYALILETSARLDAVGRGGAGEGAHRALGELDTARARLRTGADTLGSLDTLAR